MRTHTGRSWGAAWSGTAIAACAAVVALTAAHLLAPRVVPMTDVDAEAVELSQARPPAPAPAATVARAVPLERAPVAREKPLEPAGDPAVELGRRLFFDPGASHSKNVSCASCHQPDHGFSDPSELSDDDFGPTLRHSQTLLNLPPERPLHWDGEFPTVEALVTARTGPTRRADGGYDSSRSEERLMQVLPVAVSLANTRLYARGFQAAFGDPTPTAERLAHALAAYVGTLESTESPYDRWADGDASALTAQALRGLDLFRGRAGCAQCHTLDRSEPTFTDGLFHNTGVVRRRVGAREQDMRAATIVFNEPRAQRKTRANVRRAMGDDDGRALVTKNPLEARAFKTPSLRDVAVRAPYMHDASFATLEEVVRYYAVECGSVHDPQKDALVKPFGAGTTAAQITADVSDLVAFLTSLTGERRAGLADVVWSVRPERMRLRVVERTGAPWRHVVSVAPAGDAVPVADRALDVSRNLMPDGEGWIELPPYGTTHVKLTFPGTDLRPVSGDLVPDICHEGTIQLENPPVSPVRRR